MRSKMKKFGTIVPEILSEICEDLTYVNPTYARFTVHYHSYHLADILRWLDLVPSTLAISAFALLGSAAQISEVPTALLLHQSASFLQT